MAKVVIFGAGDIARLAYYYFEHDSDHTVAAFAVDERYRQADEFLGLPLVNFAEILQRFAPSDYKMFIALSYARMNAARAEKYNQAKEMGFELVSYISSKCTFLTEHPIGDNCFILEDNTIQPFVKIGSNVTMWSGNHVGHDSIIDDHCFITAHTVISGHVHIHRNCFVGVNATLRDSISIAPETLIGAGAVIMKDTVAKGVYLPQRATLFEKRSDEIEM